jgi:hypothetical protein
MLSQLRKTITWFAFILILTSLSACRNDPMGRTVERIDELVVLMDTHKEDPDALLKELDAFIKDNAEGFAKDREELLAMDAESLLQLSGKHEDILQARLMDLMDVTLEIQDRLRYSPDKLKQFQKLIERLR